MCNEHRELDRLLSLLLPFVRPVDEVVVLVDQKKATAETYNTLVQYPQVLKRDGDFTGNFAEWRNLLTSLCSKDWIFQIDADEVVVPTLISRVQECIQNAWGMKAFALPRINTVQGLTQEDIAKWHWQVNDNGWVNWPDWQIRVFQNDRSCKYVGDVHEHLVCPEHSVASIGEHPMCALIHPKTIERQRKQNELYATYNSK